MQFMFFKQDFHMIVMHMKFGNLSGCFFKITLEREPSYTVGGNANEYSHYGEQCGDFLKTWK